MTYYQVLIGDMKFHGKEALTYSSDSPLKLGQVVRIPMRGRSVLGIVTQTVDKPSFAAKSIDAVAPAPPLPSQILELIWWLWSYYPAPLGAIVRQFLPPTTAFSTRPPKISANLVSQQELPRLTGEQQQALETIKTSGYHLIHGVTGSGKTRLYIELIRRAIATKKSAIILTPEIGLTTQLYDDISSGIGFSPLLVHSRMTAAERRDIWFTVANSADPLVVIGPRSAIFAPLKNVGIIVLDEAHDQSYKSDSAPHYRTERVAAKLAALHQAALVCGTATPNVDEYFLAQSKNRPIVHLTSRAIDDKAKTDIDIIDMRNDASKTSSQILSKSLVEAINKALSSGEQSLLFLNRRGTANVILCSTCGWQDICPHCDLPLSYHGDTHQVRCHVCGRSYLFHSSCPDCGSTDIILRSIGTKAVVEEVKKLFPSARVVRFDTDTHKHEQLDQQLAALKDGSIDIIVGTQMITKGLDLPELSVVGVINADSGLSIPDYSAAERTFQLISQVAGRVGRGHRSGRLFIQTYCPNHPVITTAAKQNWRAFYDNEIEERRSFHFPPFVFMARLTCLRARSATAELAAKHLKEKIAAKHPKTHIEGPSPAFHHRESYKYKWQLILKSSSRTELVKIINNLPANWQYDIDPVDLL